MGHGGTITEQSSPNKNKEYLLTADGYGFFYKEGLRQSLDNTKYRWLVDKPKIALIQACRGGTLPLISLFHKILCLCCQTVCYIYNYECVSDTVEAGISLSQPFRLTETDADRVHRKTAACSDLLIGYATQPGKIWVFVGTQLNFFLFMKLEYIC